MRKNSRCVHGNRDNSHQTGAISVPIYQSATFAHPGVGRSLGYDYSRLQNPTREHLEKTVARLEHGLDALAFSTGMAAFSCVMELFQPGDHILATDDLYGGSYRLFSHISEKNGLTFDYINTSYPEEIRHHIRPETKAIIVETPSNPLMQVTDIALTAEIAKKNGALLIVDNTFLSPYFQNPLLLGADIVLHSGTKFLGGHNDLLAGFAVTNREDISEKLRFLFKTTGACLSPYESWLMIRSIKTLSVRMERQQQTALDLAGWLSQQKQVKTVYYVGLPYHPSYAVSKEQSSGSGSMISFEVDSPETAVQILERVHLIAFAESLGGVESLMTYPYLQTHADIPEEDRKKRGIHDRLLRLSVGLEDIQDLIEDLAQALA